MPAWVGIAVGALGGIFGFAFDFGHLTGVGLLTVAGTGAGVAIIRLIALGAQNAARGIEEGHNSLFAAIDSIGVRAERIFATTVRPVLAGAFGPDEGGKQPEAGHELRGYLKAFVVATYLLLGVALIFFGAGVIEAFESYDPAPAIDLPSYP